MSLLVLTMACSVDLVDDVRGEALEGVVCRDVAADVCIEEAGWSVRDDDVADLVGTSWRPGLYADGESGNVISVDPVVDEGTVLQVVVEDPGLGRYSPIGGGVHIALVSWWLDENGEARSQVLLSTDGDGAATQLAGDVVLDCDRMTVDVEGDLFDQAGGYVEDLVLDVEAPLLGDEVLDGC
jgi:hypothetical protein